MILLALLFILAFLEGNISVIPADALSLVLILYLGYPLPLVFVTNYLGNVLGFILGYKLGLTLKSGKKLGFLDLNKINEKVKKYKKLNYLLVSIASLTPFLPFSYFSIYSGFAGLNFLKTLLLVIVFRGIRLVLSLILIPSFLISDFWLKYFKKLFA